MIDFPMRQLPSVNAGRIFARTNRDGCAYVGVIELSASVRTEFVYGFRLNDKLWLDDLIQENGNDRMGCTRLGREDLKELSVNELLTTMKFGTGIAHYQEFFVRRSELEHVDAGKQWCLVASATRTRSPFMPEDGLYELSPTGLQHVLTQPGLGIGMNLGNLLNEPMWGPGGQFGFSHSMDPDYYPKWVGQHRASSQRADPRFARYAQLMAQHGEPPLVFNREQKQARNQLSKSVIQQIMQEEAQTAGHSGHKMKM